MWLPQFMDWFAAGMLFALIHNRLRLPDPPRWMQRFNTLADDVGTCLVLSAGFFLLAATPIAGPYTFGEGSASQAFVRHYLYLAAAATFVLPGFLGTDGWGAWRRFLASPLMAYLGTISYGIFLWHLFALETVSYVFGISGFSGWFWLLWPSTVLGTVVLAHLSYVLIERPAQRYCTPRRGWSGPIRTAPPGPQHRRPRQRQRKALQTHHSRPRPDPGDGSQSHSHCHRGEGHYGRPQSTDQDQADPERQHTPWTHGQQYPIPTMAAVTCRAVGRPPTGRTRSAGGRTAKYTTARAASSPITRPHRYVESGRSPRKPGPPGPAGHDKALLPAVDAHGLQLHSCQIRPPAGVEVLGDLQDLLLSCSRSQRLAVVAPLFDVRGLRTPSGTECTLIANAASTGLNFVLLRTRPGADQQEGSTGRSQTWPQRYRRS